jgi:hypothetical protein
MPISGMTEQLIERCDCGDDHFISFVGITFPEDDCEGYIEVCYVSRGGLPWRMRLQKMWDLFRGREVTHADLVLSEEKGERLRAALADWLTQSRAGR